MPPSTMPGWVSTDRSDCLASLTSVALGPRIRPWPVVVGVVLLVPDLPARDRNLGDHGVEQPERAVPSVALDARLHEVHPRLLRLLRAHGRSARVSRHPAR